MERDLVGMDAISIDDPRQESLFEILPRAIADAVKGNVEIAVINAPIHVGEFQDGEHVYAPRVAIEGGIIYRKFPNVKWEIDALVSPSGSVFFTRIEDTLESVKRHVAKHGVKPAITIELHEPNAHCDCVSCEAQTAEVDREHLRDELEAATGQSYSDEALQAHIDAAGS